jgi:FkbM family methyltransferase
MNNLIFDIGFNNGDDTAFYLYRGFNVIAVDANPIMTMNGSKRFAKEIDEGRLVIINKGIAPDRVSMPFYINTVNDQLSSFIKDAGGRGDDRTIFVEVECVKITDLLSRYGIPHYLKIDIEGYDRKALSTIDPTLYATIPTYISAECHEEGCIDELVRLGYNSFKFISQNDFARQNMEGWSFSRNSSGNFGEDTTEPWVSESMVRDMFRSAPTDDWFDIHAKKV